LGRSPITIQLFKLWQAFPETAIAQPLTAIAVILAIMGKRAIAWIEQQLEALAIDLNKKGTKSMTEITFTSD
jgi:hypothetical protein